MPELVWKTARRSPVFRADMTTRARQWSSPATPERLVRWMQDSAPFLLAIQRRRWPAQLCHTVSQPAAPKEYACPFSLRASVAAVPLSPRARGDWPKRPARHLLRATTAADARTLANHEAAQQRAALRRLCTRELQGAHEFGSTGIRPADHAPQDLIWPRLPAAIAAGPGPGWRLCLALLG